jgi:hypothetical protein
MGQKTAVAAIATAVLLAVSSGVKAGHVEWSAVGYAALVALAGVCESATRKPTPLVPRDPP